MKKRARRSRPDPEAPSFARLIDRYIGQLLTQGYAESTTYSYRLHLDDLRRFLAVERVEAVEAEHLLAYQQDLGERRGRTTKERWRINSQRDALIVMKGFFRWLVKTQVLLLSPADAIELPKPKKALPPRPLTHRQVERFVTSIDLRHPLNLRERAIVETLYSTGLRCSELRGLDLEDLDADRGLLRVRHAKGGRERKVPIGDRAVYWLERYLEEVRPRHLRWPDEQAIFLSIEGSRISDNQIHTRLKDLGFRARRRVHLLRHTAATVMLERGADLRYVQELLGHRQLSSTTVYTHVAIGPLKRVHQTTHPAELAERAEKPKKRRRAAR